MTLPFNAKEQTGLGIDDVYSNLRSLSTMDKVCDPEGTAQYFMEVRQDFESLKRSLSALAGSIILFHAQGNCILDVSPALFLASRTLEESRDHLHTIHVPAAFERHHLDLLCSVKELLNVCDTYEPENNLLFLKKDTVSILLNHVQNVYTTLKKTVCMPLGLSMVAVEAGCACGLHGRSRT